MLSEAPYWFSRVLEKEGCSDRVIIGLDLETGSKEVAVSGVFPEGTLLKDAYSGETCRVKKGKAVLDSPFDIVLLEAI